MIRLVALASIVGALAACRDAAAPSVHPGDYQITIAFQGQRIVLTGHDAAFSKYNYKPSVTSDTLMSLSLGDTLSFIQFEFPPTYLPTPGTVPVIGGLADASRAVLVRHGIGAGHHRNLRAHLCDRVNSCRHDLGHWALLRIRSALGELNEHRALLDRCPRSDGD